MLNNRQRRADPGYFAMTNKALSVSLLAAALLTGRAQAMPPTSLEKAELSMMSVPKQKEVLTRATGDTTVDGAIETLLLNQISDAFAQGTVVAIDFDDAVMVVRGRKGQLRSYEIDTFNLTLKEPAKSPAPAL